MIVQRRVNALSVVGVDYSLAPARTFPTPIRQVNTALGYLVKNAERLRIDPSHIVLAGDSGGAHIAGGDRQRHRGAVLCGPCWASCLPALPHEYQFNLDNEAGRRALERSLAFLARQVKQWRAIP